MSTEQDNFAGMTAQQKVKSLILMRYRQWGNTVPRLTAEGGKVRPWTIDNVARISEMAEAYLGQGEAE